MTLGVSQAILALIDKRRLSATSVMSNRPHWPSLAPELRKFKGRIDIGLHLNLTLGTPLGQMPGFAPGGEFPSIGAITREALLGGLPRDEIGREIERQLVAFEAEMQGPPDFIDGHQHVHALPGIRDLLVHALVARYPEQKPYLRNPADGLSAILARGVAIQKALSVKALAQGLTRLARQSQIATNQGFAGFSPFDPARDFAADFGRFLISPGARHLIMCHPGEIDAELIGLDPVVATRPQELAFLMSDGFNLACQAAGMELRRFAEL